jgi:hypothetical protein
MTRDVEDISIFSISGNYDRFIKFQDAKRSSSWKGKKEKEKEKEKRTKNYKDPLFGGWWMGASPINAAQGTATTRWGESATRAREPGLGCFGA